MPRSAILSFPAAAVLAAAALGASPGVAGGGVGQGGRVARPLPDGAVVYQQTCARCHNARTPDELPPASWETVVLHMRVRAGLPARDAAAVALWLAPPTPSGLADRAAEARTMLPDVPLVADRCVTCHDAARVGEARAQGRDQATWAATLRRMVSYGAKLAAEEEAGLSRALAAGVRTGGAGP